MPNSLCLWSWRFHIGVRRKHLVGANVADGALRRYTAVVFGAKGPCSGVILAQDVVLTAAHCVQADPNIRVFDTPVRATAVHPLYRADPRTSDLAVLKLATPLPDRFSPAVVHRRELSKGTVLIAAGYGHSSANDYAAGTALHMLPLQVSDIHEGWVILARAYSGPLGAGPGDFLAAPAPTLIAGSDSVVALIIMGTTDEVWAISLAAHYHWITETIEKLDRPESRQSAPASSGVNSHDEEQSSS